MLHRLPSNLLRQEVIGTSIYLEILHRSTAIENNSNHDRVNSEDELVQVTLINESGDNASLDWEENLKGVAEEKLVSFCGQILKEASELKPYAGEDGSSNFHRVLDLRAPVIVKVWCVCIHAYICIMVLKDRFIPANWSWIKLICIGIPVVPSYIPNTTWSILDQVYFSYLGFFNLLFNFFII